MNIVQGGVSVTPVGDDDDDGVTVTEEVDNVFNGIYRIKQKKCGLIGGTFTGTISGAQVTLTLTDNSGASISFTGNITNAIRGIARAMSGLLNATKASCPDFTGSWSMSRLN